VKLKPYWDRLFHLNLPTLKYRRLRGDIIEVLKIIQNIYDIPVSHHPPFNTRANTRRNSYELYDLRKHSFSAGVVNIWNN